VLELEETAMVLVGITALLCFIENTLKIRWKPITTGLPVAVDKIWYFPALLYSLYAMGKLAGNPI
jgi:hypothetical protein